MIEQKKLSPLVRLVDDDEMVLRSESFLVRMDGWQTAEYSSAEEFLERDDFTRPGCVVLDIRMPRMSGIELQSLMNQRNIDLPIIFLTGHGDIDKAVSSMKKGAVDFLVKPPSEERFQEAVKAAVEKDVTNKTIKFERQTKEALFAELTPREQEIALPLAKGSANKVIAIDLNISEQSIKKYRSSLMGKLGIRTTVELNEFLRSIGKL